MSTMACKCSLVSVVGVFLVLTLFQNSITVAGQVSLFTFGDSNFDAGNKQFFSTSRVAENVWPYGISRDLPNDRFSDGFIAPDFVTKFLGIPIDIPLALKPDDNVSFGASFADADATLLESPAQSMTLNQQVRKFNQMKAANWKDDFIQKSLFMIYVGADDYLNFTKQNPNADASAQQAFVTSVTNKLKNDISFLYSSGASKFLIQNLAPLGCLPIVRQDYNTGLDKCHEPLNDLAKMHNQKIGPMLNEMARTASGFQFSIFDFYNVILRRAARNIDYRSRSGLEFGPGHVISPTGIHKATIVWLHDLGHKGIDSIQALRNLGLPNIKWICPTAPKRPVTSLGGRETRAWCDHTQVSENMQEDFESLDYINSHIADLLSNEPEHVTKGVGGVGLGAAQALYFASSYAFGRVHNINLQIVIGINGWLPGLRYLDYSMATNFGSAIRAASLRILLMHGTSDDVVPSAFAYKCANNLLEAGFPTMFKQCGGDHVMNEIFLWLTTYAGI